MRPQGVDPAVEHDAAVERMERSNRNYNRVKMILTVLTLLSVLVGFWIIQQQGQDQRERIISCTTPEGECAQRNAAGFQQELQNQRDEFQRMLDEQTGTILRGVAEMLMKSER